MPGDETYIVRPAASPMARTSSAKATSAAEEGRFAAAKFLRNVAALSSRRSVRRLSRRPRGGGSRDAVQSVLE